MKWVLAYFVALFGLTQLVGCTTPTKTLNLLTPDRLGLGRATGVMSMRGSSNGSYDGEWWGDPYGGHGGEFGDSSSDLDLEGESEADLVWLEWDFPQWKEPNDYDRYLRERVRTLSLEKELLLKEKDLEKKNKAINKTIKRIDDALECTVPEREQVGMWPKKLTEQYGTGGG